MYGCSTVKWLCVCVQYKEYEQVVVEDRIEKERRRQESEREARELRAAIHGGLVARRDGAPRTRAVQEEEEEGQEGQERQEGQRQEEVKWGVAWLLLVAPPQGSTFHFVSFRDVGCARHGVHSYSICDTYNTYSLRHVNFLQSGCSIRV